MKLKKGDYIFISIIVIVVVITLLIINNDKVVENENSNKTNNIIVLKDYSRFFTLESCIYKFINYWQIKDSNSLIKILDDKYISDNGINNDNVFDFIGSLDGINSFKLKDVYYDRRDSNIITYYVFGEIVKEEIDTYQIDGIDKYFVINLDTVNKIYSIEPIDSGVYMEVING